MIQRISPFVAFDATNYFAVWQDQRNGSSNYDIYGARVTQSGTVLEPNGIAISTASGHQSAPSLAFDGNQYFVTWQDQRGGNYDIYGTRVSTGGIVADPSGMVISQASGDQTNPKIAYDGSTFFLGWQDQRSGGSDLYGARVTSSGAVLDPTGIAISTAPGDQASPILACDGVTCQVAWHDSRAGTNDIYFTAITHDGAVLNAAGALVSYVAPSNSEAVPAVGATDFGYLVAWRDDRAGVGNYNIYGAVLDLQGNALTPYGVPISTAAAHQDEPAVACGHLECLVVWHDERNGLKDIYGTRVDAFGTVIDSAGLVLSTAANDQRKPAVAATGSGYLVVWEDERAGAADPNIYGTRVSATGSVQNLSGLALSTAPLAQRVPAVASDGTRYLVVWQDERSGAPDIYGTRVTTAGAVLEPAGLALSVSDGDQRAPALAWTGVNYLAAWEDTRNGGLDLYGARVSAAGALLDDAHAHAQEIAISTAAGDQAAPAIAGVAGRAVVAWQDKRSGNDDIYVTEVGSDGAVLGPAGIAVSASGAIERTPAVAAANLDRALVVHSRFDEAQPFNASRVRAKLVGRREGGPIAADRRRVDGAGVSSARWATGSLAPGEARPGARVQRHAGRAAFRRRLGGGARLRGEAAREAAAELSARER